MLEKAYKRAREILESRKGAGFTMTVTMNSGKEFNVIPRPDDPIDAKAAKHVWFWECQDGDVPIVLRHSEIAAIQVHEV